MFTVEQGDEFELASLLKEKTAGLKVSSPSTFIAHFWRMYWNHTIVLYLFIWPIPAFEVLLSSAIYNVLVWSQYIRMDLLSRFYIKNW